MEEKRCIDKLLIRVCFVFAISCLLVLPDYSGCGGQPTEAEATEKLAPVAEVPEPAAAKLYARVDIKPSVSEAVKPVFKNSKNKSARKRPKKGERKYNDIIVRAADRHNIDPAMIKAIIMAESGYDPSAVSKKGAMGLMQLMPETAEAMGVENGFDPEHNINGGTKYFRQLLDRFDGEIELALAAYQAGSGKVRKYNGVPPYRSTQRYIRKVITYYERYKTGMKKDIDRA